MVISHHVVQELNHGPLGKSSQCFYLRSLHRNKVWWNIAISQALGRLWYKNHNCSPFWAIKQGSVIGNLKDKKSVDMKVSCQFKVPIAVSVAWALWAVRCRSPSPSCVLFPNSHRHLLGPAQTECRLIPKACLFPHSCWCSSQNIYRPLFIPIKDSPTSLQDFLQCLDHTSSWHCHAFTYCFC